MDQLEKELCQMEEGVTDLTKTSVLLNDRLTPKEHNQVLSVEQLNELRAHQLLTSNGTANQLPRLPVQNPQDRVLNSLSTQMDSLT